MANNIATHQDKGHHREATSSMMAMVFSSPTFKRVSGCCSALSMTSSSSYFLNMQGMDMNYKAMKPTFNCSLAKFRLRHPHP